MHENKFSLSGAHLLLQISQHLKSKIFVILQLLIFTEIGCADTKKKNVSSIQGKKLCSVCFGCFGMSPVTSCPSPSPQWASVSPRRPFPLPREQEGDGSSQGFWSTLFIYHKTLGAVCRFFFYMNTTYSFQCEVGCESIPPVVIRDSVVLRGQCCMLFLVSNTSISMLGFASSICSCLEGG